MMSLEELRQISINDVVPQELLAESDMCILCQSITTHITPSGTSLCDEHWQAYQTHKDKWWQYLSIDKDIKAGMLPHLPCLDCGKWAWAALPHQAMRIIICSHCLPPRYWAKLALPTKKEEIMKSPKATASPPITLSHSQLETWQQCQLKWRLTKIDKVQRAPSEALILGTAFHAALEEDGRRKIVHNMNLQDFQMLDIFDKTMRGVLFADDPNNLITKAKQTAMRAKAQLMILKYIEIVQPTFKPVSVESSFTFAVSDAVKFTGRIDAVTARGIVDWKTAGKPWDSGIQHSKDQAQAYLTALPEQSQVSFAVFSTDGNTAAFQSLATQRDEAKAAAYKAKVLDTAQQIQTAKETGQFEAKVGPLCPWCEVWSHCTAGQAWMKLKGKVPVVPAVKTDQ